MVLVHVSSRKSIDHNCEELESKVLRHDKNNTPRDSYGTGSQTRSEHDQSNPNEMVTVQTRELAKNENDLHTSEFNG